MPELPEVETIRRDLYKKILGKKIESIALLSPSSVKNPGEFFAASLDNNSIKNIDRIGKLLIFELQEKSLFLLVHLKMTGKLLYAEKMK